VHVGGIGAVGLRAQAQFKIGVRPGPSCRCVRCVWSPSYPINDGNDKAGGGSWRWAEAPAPSSGFTIPSTTRPGSGPTHPAAPEGAAAPPADAPAWSAQGLGRNPRARPSRPRRHAAALARVAWGDAGMHSDAQAVPAALGVQMQEALATPLLRHGRSYDVWCTLGRLKGQRLWMWRLLGDCLRTRRSDNGTPQLAVVATTLRRYAHDSWPPTPACLRSSAADLAARTPKVYTTLVALFATSRTEARCQPSPAMSQQPCGSQRL